MKYVTMILMLLILVVACTPSGNTVTSQPQTPGAVDNESTSTAIQPPVASPTPSQELAASAPLSISNVKYEITPKGYPPHAYDVTVTWTTSTPATSEVDYIRSDNGSLATSYTLKDNIFGYGCPIPCDYKVAGTFAVAKCWAECINEITYINKDSKLVTEHYMVLRDLYADRVISETATSRIYKVFYFKVTSTSENNQTVESPAYSFTLDWFAPEY